MTDVTNDKDKYLYVRIADLQAGVYNVFGVVKFCKLPVQTKGTDLAQVLSITDESLADGDKMVVTLFYSSSDSFPQATVGDVIRFHRLRVENVNEKLKGRPGPGFSWLLVHDDVDNPTVSSKKYTFGSSSKQRVEQLQRWSRQQRWLKETAMTTLSLKSLVPSQYCDVVCQVVGKALKEKRVCEVLRVWDGTLCPYKTVDMDEPVETDPALNKAANGLTVDIWVYDDHVDSCSAIRPGHFIKLNNLHAAIYKIKGENDAVLSAESPPTLELVMHRGTAFGRGVVLLDEQSPLVAPVRQRLDPYLSGESSGPGTHKPNLTASAMTTATTTISTTTITTTTISGQMPSSTRGPVSKQAGSNHKAMPQTQVTSAMAGGDRAEAAQAGCSYWTQTGGHGHEGQGQSELNKSRHNHEGRAKKGSGKRFAQKSDKHSEDQDEVIKTRSKWKECSRKKNNDENELCNGRQQQQKTQQKMDGGQKAQAGDHSGQDQCQEDSDGNVHQQRYSHKQKERDGKECHRNQVSAYQQHFENFIVTSSSSDTDSLTHQPMVSSDVGNNKNDLIVLSSNSLSERQEEITRDSAFGESNPIIVSSNLLGRRREEPMPDALIRKHAVHHTLAAASKRPSGQKSLQEGQERAAYSDLNSERMLVDSHRSAETSEHLSGHGKVVKCGARGGQSGCAGSGGGESGDGDGSSGGLDGGGGRHQELRLLMSSSGSRSGSSGKSKAQEEPSFLSHTERCMLQTATVVCGHQHMSCTSISEVLCGPVPGKFRVLAHLVDFYPNTLDPWQFVRQLCPKCNHMAVPDREAISTARTVASSAGPQSALMSVTSSITSKLASLLGGRLVNWKPERLQSPKPDPHLDMPELCPRCKSEGVTTPLELIYMLRLVLHDSSGDYLVANLWREQAVTFFRGVHPEVVVSQQGMVEDMVTTLRSLCMHRPDNAYSPSSSPPPCLDCCLFSYITNSVGGGGGEVNFHIFDTVLV